MPYRRWLLTARMAQRLVRLQLRKLLHQTSAACSMNDTLNKMTGEVCDFATAATHHGGDCRYDRHTDWPVVGPSLGIDRLARPRRLSAWRSALRLAERGCFVRPWTKGVFGKRPFRIGLDVLRPIIRDAVVGWGQKAGDAVWPPGNAHSGSGYRFADPEPMICHGCYPGW